MSDGNTAGRHRPRVLMSAYACGPESGPEAVAGWEFALAASRDHDVWVITRPRFREVIEKTLHDDPAIAEHLTVVYYDPPAWLDRLRRFSWDLYWYYLLWQRGVRRVAGDLHRRVDFDIVHHVTFANDWMPAGAATVKGPRFVWGPIGGSSSLPIAKLSRWLGVRGTVTEILRAVVTRALRAVGGNSAARRADLVVAQNPQVADHFRRIGSRTTVEPNASLTGLPSRAAVPDERTAVFAGRLLAWKGAALAIDTIADPRLSGWKLQIFGTGYEQRRLRRLVARRGLGDRVEFHGHAPREKLLAHLARATVFLFPSMHDQAGWVVAEASSIGCPVVCLPLGGPPVLAQPNDYVASLRGDVVGNLVEKVLEAAAEGAVPSGRWETDRLPDIVTGWYRTVLSEPTAHETDPTTPGRSLTVLESFSTPKATTNPYITQLYRSLNARSDVSVIPFSYRAAILGRYDVAHLHWPELLMGGHKRIGRVARRALTAVMVARWRLTRTPVVRTVHNLERPTNITKIDHWLLDRIDAATSADIHLNDQTPQRAAIPSTTIRHGHYREWFAEYPQSAPTPGRIGYVGLIRRYKGVEDLVSAFVEWNLPDVQLHISGKPSSTELVRTLEERAAGDDRVTIDPRFLSEAELVEAISASELIVLPYRHMHNSGTALAALSLGRPVLVPDNDVNRALADEAGAGWVHTFSGAISAEAIARAWESSRGRSSEPDLSARDWSDAAASHLAAFRRSIGG